jgi:4-hydroxythreonine-4-phosphate dehydrogenase
MGEASGNPPVIGITMGDPAGIGPEVIVKALANRSRWTAPDTAEPRPATFFIFGLASSLEAAAERAGIRPVRWRIAHDSPRLDSVGAHDVVVLDYPEIADAPERAEAEGHGTRGGRAFAPGPSEWGGRASLRWVEDAIRAAQKPPGELGHIDAIVTAPISKTSWNLAGARRFPGHTDLLAARFNAPRTAMMFVGPTLRVTLATVHIPLLTLRDALTIGKVYDAIDLSHKACLDQGIAHPRLAVCGMNPHAGEDGLLGDEERRIIDPAVEVAQKQGVDVRGPFPADTLFIAAARGDFDCVVAMYHDQGLIPVKLLERDEAVNVTLGLPTVRTSPAHGTAFDIAGKNEARPESMAAAVRLAVKMARRRSEADGG